MQLREVEEAFSSVRGEQHLLETVLDAAPTLVVVLDTQGRIVLFNRACARLTGFRSEEVVGRHFAQVLIPAELKDEVNEVFARLAGGDFPVEHENDWLTRDGRRKRIRFHNTLLHDEQGEITHVVATGVDVTAERVAESRARTALSQLEHLLDSCPALVGELDRDYRFVYANGEYQRWFGIHASAIRGQHAARIIGRDAFDRLRPCYDKAMEGSVAVYDGDVPYVLGGPRCIHGVYVPRTDENGNVRGCYIMAVDLTEQSRLATVLDATSRRSAAILDTAHDAIVTLSPALKIESFNRATESMFQLPGDALHGLSIDALVPDFEWRTTATDGGREAVGRRRDGSLFSVEISVGSFEAEGATHFAGFIRDISERKRAEGEARSRLDQLAHLNRTSAMGNLAAGIAHEVNQPLTAVTTMADACLRMTRSEPVSSERVQHGIEQIARQARRASDVIQEMRSFLRKDDEQRSSHENIAELLRSALDLAGHDIERKHIRFWLDMDSDLPTVRVNGIQLEQVLVNLLRNSVEAMDKRRREIHVHAFVSGREMKVLFCDSGSGVPEKLRDRLFQPFITSKPSGMGQGLSISRSIARAHRGDLQLLSTGERGSCFELSLPVAGDTHE